MHKATSAEDFIDQHPEWSVLLQPLREILLSTELEETIKWGVPVYVLKGKNVVGLVAFKNHAALWFYQGALLEDPFECLVNAQQGKTRGLRQWRFQHGDALDKKRILKYILEAAEISRRGEFVKPRSSESPPVPQELKEAFSRDQWLKAAFEKITPYKQREFIEYISEAKRQDTRARRMDKIAPMILEGKGLNDKYRS